VRQRAFTLRAIALLTAGALGVHQLRYAIGFGHESERMLTLEGHAYLQGLLPVATAFAIVALASVLLGVSRGAAAGASHRVGSLWLRASCALALAYAVQEAAEGAVASGHPAGAAAVIGGSAWIGLALAVPFGLLVALALRGADDAAAAVSRTAVAVRPIASPIFTGLRAAAGFASTPARAASARGPPVASAG
jgi:hypothetical protein